LPLSINVDECSKLIALSACREALEASP